ncbi:MAG: NAD(P)H-hydrate epimerase [Clostridia bacterium]|nr:NAD(P)H-hydrate epimerase [Clostridia bacterium]
MRIVTVAQMKQIEKNADENGLSYLQMMENAGTAAYQIIRTEKADAKRFVVMAGKGNNGGDGFVIARLAAQDGFSVSVILAEGQPVTTDAKMNFERLQDLPVTVQQLDEIDKLDADVIVDALYGTGFHGALRPSGQKACARINALDGYVIALDLPSGLQADTGIAAEGSVRADITIAFDSLKWVHVEEQATEYCGKTILVDIGIPEHCHP